MVSYVTDQSDKLWCAFSISRSTFTNDLPLQRWCSYTLLEHLRDYNGPHFTFFSSTSALVRLFAPGSTPSSPLVGQWSLSRWYIVPVAFHDFRSAHTGISAYYDGKPWNFHHSLLLNHSISAFPDDVTGLLNDIGDTPTFLQHVQAYAQAVGFHLDSTKISTFPVSPVYSLHRQQFNPRTRHCIVYWGSTTFFNTPFQLHLGVPTRTTCFMEISSPYV